MTFKEWCECNGYVPEEKPFASIWNGALEEARKEIWKYGNRFRNSSLKVGMTCDACEKICEILEVK